MSQPSRARRRDRTVSPLSPAAAPDRHRRAAAAPAAPARAPRRARRASGSRSSKLAMRAGAAPPPGGRRRWRAAARGDRAPADPRPAARARGRTRAPSRAGEPGARRDRRDRRVEEPGIAAKLVDDEAADQAPLAGAEHRGGADDRGDDPAAVDVADQHHRHPRRDGETPIGDVAGAQVDLGGAARALDQHDIGLARQLVEAAQHLSDAGASKLGGGSGCDP